MTQPANDLTSLVVAAMMANRDQINGSRLGQGEEDGIIFVYVNAAVRSVRFKVLVEDKRVA